MNIQCNDKQIQIQADTLTAALIELGYEDAIVATALNGEFVPKTLRHTTTLKPGDCLDVLAPMQGG